MVRPAVHVTSYTARGGAATVAFKASADLESAVGGQEASLAVCLIEAYGTLPVIVFKVRLEFFIIRGLKMSAKFLGHLKLR